MGALFGGICYATTNEANDAYFQTIAPTFYALGSDMHQVRYEGSGSTWWIKDYTITGNTATLNSTIAATLPAFNSCTTPNTPIENFNDGMVLAWGIVLAMIAAWAISNLRRSL